VIVIPRKKHESVVIGGNIILTLIEIRGDTVRLGIECRKAVTVHRHEVHEVLRSQNQVSDGAEWLFHPKPKW